MKKPRALVSWSSGKDSAWSLHVARQEAAFEIVGLLTTVNETHDRVAMHAVRSELLRQQAEATGLPLWEVGLPYPCSNEIYEERMKAAVHRAVAEGITHMIFGDLFLEDIRDYRIEKLRGTGIEPVFPLWKRNTRELAREMMQAGVIAHLSTVDPRQVPAHLAGRTWDERLLAELPPSADPCGENGEFHTFVAAGPMLRRPISLTVKPPIERDGFVYCDLVPEGS
jgi:uncharacterized protein (TIGR00290 family)